MLFSIAFGVLILSLFTLLGVCVRNMARLRVIDVASIPQVRTRALKDRIIMEKLQRAGRGKWRALTKIATAAVTVSSRAGRRAVQRLYAIEQYYQKLSRVASEGQHAYAPEVVKHMIDEAEVFIRQEEYIPAEKIFIDIISHNPKNVATYEGLGNLYLKKGEYDQARETFQFTLRLSPNDASVHVSLAELEIRQGHDRPALEFLRKAIGKRPKNPKYLDLFIETALRVGSLKDVRHGLLQLKKVNPDNQKIQDFAERFEKLKETYMTKTASSTDTSSQGDSSLL